MKLGVMGRFQTGDRDSINEIRATSNWKVAINGDTSSTFSIRKDGLVRGDSH